MDPTAIWRLGRDTLNSGGGNDVLRGGSEVIDITFQKETVSRDSSEGDRVVAAHDDVTAHRKGGDLILSSGEQVLVLRDAGPLRQ